MDSLASSPAGRRSTQTDMHPPSASVAAARAAANEAAGKLGLTGIQTKYTRCESSKTLVLESSFTQGVLAVKTEEEELDKLRTAPAVHAKEAALAVLSGKLEHTATALTQGKSLSTRLPSELAHHNRTQKQLASLERASA